MTTNIQPLRPYVQFVNDTGTLTTEGYNFLYNMYLRVGGSLSSLDAALLQGATWSAPAAIGSVTPSTGKFTTLEATSQLNVTGAGAFVQFTPTGVGTVQINPATTGTLDNMTIGSIVPRAVIGTSLSSTGRFACNGQPLPAPTASGGALTAYAAGANGLATAAAMQALVVQVQAIRTALVNCGIMT